ncbi:hypothetical protein GH714_032590 [Hevea brasiliensis]|uniref:non-specific serine/threonine protein kinase n=1 Tax=Hevea brasiliensis TaxID=3981 RepID=A0A6A6NC01_HEVBR|nr:hypothetical protein GH714_032590 [Hevea brasiliensis]
MWVSVDFADSVIARLLILSLANESEISGDLAALFLWEYSHIRRCCRCRGIGGMVIFLIWFCLSHKKSVSRTSETGSSEPSQGKFGEVYKGLLNDGMLVAIKKRSGAPSPEFVDEDLVVSDGKLEFKLRLSIALGAAKGDPLQNQFGSLHSQSPRLLHKDFKTANVLVDENFIAKVADAGLRNFLGHVDVAGPSSQVTADDIFLAPEVKEFRRFSDKSDVFSFGVFLLELLHGQEATESPSPDSSQNLVEWVQNTEDYSVFASIVDQKLGTSFTAEGMEEFIQLIVRCLEPSSERRPAMSYVVMELDRILEKEMSLTTVMGEGTPTVTWKPTI